MSASTMTPFPAYRGHAPLAPTWCVTPGEGRAIHRFFDTSPFSPSGRYLALTRLPSEDRLPRPGDVAEVVAVDLETGDERVVAKTRGWDTQLGTQAQWGNEDTQLFFNDLDTDEWRPYGVVLDLFTGEARKLDGTIYVVSPDGKYAASPCLLRTAVTQAGYGVIVPEDRVPRNRGAASDDGLYVTDIATGKCELLASLAEILEAVDDPLTAEGDGEGDFYGFHVKWNPEGDRLMFVVRWVPRDSGGGNRANVITMKADGTDIQCAIPASVWSKGGHHPNWCPDGEHVMMNLKTDGGAMQFVQTRHDGSDFRIMSDTVPGSGHPTLHPNEKTIVTDAYPHEPVAFGDGSTPVRLVDLSEGTERTLVRIQVTPDCRGPKGELRVDPHPAWDREFRRIAFNGCPDGTRRVYVSDLSEFVD